MAERMIPFDLPDFCPEICSNFSPVAKSMDFYSDSDIAGTIQTCECSNAALCSQLYKRLKDKEGE